MLLRILEIIVPVFGVIGVGFVYGRRFKPDVQAANALNITIFTPALILYALVEKADIDMHIGTAALGAALIVLGAGLVGWVLARLLGQRRAVVVPPIMFPNCGNLGLPVAQLAFGAASLPLMVVIMITVNTLQFTLGTWLLGDRISPKALLRNPMLVATVIGLAFMGLDWRLPAMIAPGVEMLGDISIPLMLISLGIRLSHGASGQWRMGLSGGLTATVVGLLVALATVWLLQPSQPLAAMLIIVGVMPPAVLNYMLAEAYQVEPQQVAAIVAVGHLIALLALPLTLAFLL